MQIIVLLAGYTLSILILLGLLFFIGLTIRTRLVPYVTTHDHVIDVLKKHVRLSDNESFIELGCGDARILSKITETHPGLTARGYEISPYAFRKAQKRQQQDEDRYTVHYKNFMKEDLSDGTVFYAYLLPHFMKPLWKKLQSECSPGTKLYSNAFFVPDVDPVDTLVLKEKKGTRTLYVYEI